MQDNIKQLGSSIVVKIKDGGFKLWRDGEFEDLPSEEVMIRREEIVTHTPTAIIEEKPTADFYFSVDDEEDARKITNNDSAANNQKIREFIEKLAEKIIEDSGLEKSKINNNLKHIIISRLRDVRSLAETREALTKVAAFGGAELTDKEVEKMMSLIENEREKAETAIRTGRIEISISKKEEKTENIFEKPAPFHTPKKDFVEIQYKKSDTGLHQGEHKTIGVVEEIGALTLAEFRKLGNNPFESANHIWEKINLLEDESLIKKSEGIKAWQKSEAGRLYLIIGAESMKQKITVREIIEKRKKEGQAYLTPEEFDVVADLNRRLSY